MENFQKSGWFHFELFYVRDKIAINVSADLLIFIVGAVPVVAISLLILDNITFLEASTDRQQSIAKNFRERNDLISTSQKLPNKIVDSFCYKVFSIRVS